MLRPLQGLAYGALGLPLAFVALPLYVLLPAHYGATLGVPLAALGALLLGARLFDAVVDPWIGRWIDRCHARGRHVVLRVAAAACAVLAAGFVALFFPPVQGTAALLAWCGAMLALTYLAYSALSVVHQSWGARLGGDEAQRAGVVSWREGCALAGVMVASVLPALAGFGATAAVLAVALVLGVTALARWAPAADRPVAHGSAASPWLPLQTPAFRRLLAIHVVNGVASAIPATLVLFFVRDRLQAASLEPLFLAAYFAAGALSMPLWVRVIARLGLARSWLAGMLLSVASFVWAASLGPGDAAAFAAVCIASGLALGADLAVPQAWLAGIVQRWSERHA
jgi:Na+/melibiose symporter-like transporter